jgi:hypothetical protein
VFGAQQAVHLAVFQISCSEGFVGPDQSPQLLELSVVEPAVDQPAEQGFELSVVVMFAH